MYTTILGVPSSPPTRLRGSNELRGFSSCIRAAILKVVLFIRKKYEKRSCRIDLCFDDSILRANRKSEFALPTENGWQFVVFIRGKLLLMLLLLRHQDATYGRVQLYGAGMSRGRRT